MPPLIVYKADDGYFVAPKSPDLEHALWARASEFYKKKSDAEARLQELFVEFMETGVYPQPVAHKG